MNNLDSDGVVLHSRPKGFEIELDSALLYASGSAELRGDVQGTLSQVGERLKAFGEDEFEIEVQGHTDSAPINSARYASNWELSAARATGVVRFFIESGLPSTQLRASAFADTHPKKVKGIDKVQGHAANRRVVIRVSYLDGTLDQ
jgi:chemotaxis protein MotB